MGDQAPFKDAEAFLRDLGVEREPIEVPLDAGPAPDAAVDASGAQLAPTRQGVAESTPPSGVGAIDGVPADEHEEEGPHDGSGAQEAVADGLGPAGEATDAAGPTLSAPKAMDLATQVERDAALRAADAAALPDPDGRTLEADVSAAVGFVRASTAGAPQSEGRLRDKLERRGVPGQVIAQAMERARRERLVDDEALIAALVDERRGQGHAPARIRRDLQDRGFARDDVDRALESADQQDPEAAAFAIAQARAARLTALPAETAYRRVVGYLARRGHPEGLARKVAREAVFVAREAERTSER